MSAGIGNTSHTSLAGLSTSRHILNNTVTDWSYFGRLASALKGRVLLAGGLLDAGAIDGVLRMRYAPRFLGEDGSKVR